MSTKQDMIQELAERLGNDVQRHEAEMAFEYLNKKYDIMKRVAYLQADIFYRYECIDADWNAITEMIINARNSEEK